MMDALDAVAVSVLRVVAWVWGAGSVLFGIATWFITVFLSGRGSVDAATLLGSVVSAGAIIVQGVIVWALLYGAAVVVEYAMMRRDALHDAQAEEEAASEASEAEADKARTASRLSSASR